MSDGGNGAIGLAVDETESVYLGNLSVVRIEPNGTAKELLDSNRDGAGNRFGTGIGLDVDPFGTVYVSGHFTDNMFSIDPNGIITEIIDEAGEGAGNTFDGPTDIAVDGRGNVYVAASGDKVFRVDPSGLITVVIDGSRDGIGSPVAPLSSLTSLIRTLELISCVQRGR